MGFRDKEFRRSIFVIALPIIIQQLATSSLNFIDVIMVGRLGETSIASVGLSSNFTFIYICLLNGISTGASIFAAQFWGKKEVHHVRSVLGFSLLLSLSVSLLFSFASIFFPGRILSIYTNDPEVIEQGRIFLRLIGFSFVATSITFCYSAVLRSIGNAKLPMFVSVFALSLNTLLNYLLIFGNLGFPALGLKGSAIATLVSRLVEFGLIVSSVYIFKIPLVFKRIRDFFSVGSGFVRKYFITTIPLVLGITFWSLGLNFYNISYAHIGTQAVAAYSVAGTVEQIAFVVFTGLSGACNVLIGNRIGAGHKDKVLSYSRSFIWLAFTGSLIVGACIYLLSGPVLTLYSMSAEAHMAARTLLLLMSCFLCVKVVNMILIQGVLNAGGDTVFTLVQNSAAMWAVGIPMAYIAVYRLHLPIYWVYIFIMSEEFAKLIIGVPRFLSKKWIHNLTENTAYPNQRGQSEEWIENSM
ncbi:MATE family efflux transporter [Paenibacillus tianjinensis]|uniref:MATE family efflux transporter n=1 Tax=Paenibacillus tianjinensis TaxID=2810347 RepID=A0ABX7LC58_9BACL|nr:MATE family efflux transporter [Paenibacillus tianjinensis]QSF44383.1 MATE family efflux transporter [Paenibacillus tianjinensis]